MKKILLITLFLICNLVIAQDISIDIIYLKDGSVIKGTITKMVIDKELILKMDDDSTIILEMDRIQKIEKDQSSTIPSYEKSSNYDRNDTTIEKWEEKVDNSLIANKKKKRKGKFWKVLGDLAVATINKTAENIKNQPSGEDQEYYGTEEYEDAADIIEDEYENTHSSTIESTGSICFVNPNIYARKIIFINRNSKKEETITVGKANYRKTNSSCIYDIPTGIYNCKIFTVFSKKMIAQYSIRINEGEEASKILTKNNYN